MSTPFLIHTYAGFSEADIVARASNTCDLTANGDGTVGGTNYTTTRVKSVLGESTTGIAALDNSNNVNKWSGFSPFDVAFSGGQITFTNNTIGKTGNMIGYNHNALPAAVLSKVTSRTVYPGDTQVDISCTLRMGEINWYAAGAKYVALEIYDTNGTTLLGRALSDLQSASYGTQSLFLQYMLSLGSHSSSWTVYAKIVFLNSSYAQLAYFNGESYSYSVSLNWATLPTLNFAMTPNLPYTTYTSYKGPSSAINLSAQTVAIYVGIDTTGDGNFNPLTCWMYISKGSTYYYYDNASGTWVSWNSNNTTPPPTTARITTYSGSAYWSVTKSLPFSVGYGDTVYVHFGDVPRPI